jgi:hypothetical protein
MGEKRTILQRSLGFPMTAPSAEGIDAVSIMDPTGKVRALINRLNADLAAARAERDGARTEIKRMHDEVLPDRQACIDHWGKRAEKAETKMTGAYEECAKIADVAAKKYDALGRYHQTNDDEAAADRCYARAGAAQQIASDIRQRADTAMASEWPIIKALVADEGSSVTICSDNADFNGLPNSVVIVQGGWTNWREKDFTGETVLKALQEANRALLAAIERAQPTKGEG